MAKTNKKVRTGTKPDGMEKDTSGKTETFRGYSEGESFIGSATTPIVERTASRLLQRKK